MRYQAPRGTNDVLPSESGKWIQVESAFRSLARLYGYAEIRTPMFEDTELFARTSGETSDIVTKQMYSFKDRGDRDLTLKPEGTAPAIRAVIEHNLCPPGTVCRLSYVTDIFRYERPQKGRFRQAHQLGLELLGSLSPAADAEIIEVTIHFYRSLGLKGLRVLLNSLGRDECRARFREALLKYATPYLETQSEDFRERARKNPLRLLDSKDPEVQKALEGAPPVTDFLEPESKTHFERVQELLSSAGVEFLVEPNIVRGLDYYTGVVFEVHSSGLGAQSALCGGGRYDHLVEEIGGAPTPSVGVGMGIERLLMVLDEEGISLPSPALTAYVACATEAGQATAASIARDLRARGVSVLIDLDGRSLKSQLRTADKSGASWVVIVGDDELARGAAQLKNLTTGKQEEVPIASLVDRLTGLK